MLRIGKYGRNLTKLRAAAPSARAELSTTPKPSDGQKKAAAGGGGFPIGSLLVVTAFAGLGIVAFKKETDSGFADLVNKNAAFINTVVDPIQSAIKSSGLVTAPKKETKQPPRGDEPPADTYELESAEEIADSLIESFESFDTIAKEEEQATQHAGLSKSVTTEEEPVIVIDFPKELAEEVERATEVASAAAHHESHAQPFHANDAHEQELSSSVESAIASIPPVAAEGYAKKLQSQAVAEVLDELAIQSAALRRELELTVLKDIDTLDAKELRERLKRLSEQYFEKAKWETLRLHQSMRHVEADVRRQSVDKMSEQRAQLELEMNKIINEKEAELTKALHAHYEEQAASLLRAQAEGFNSTLKKELQDSREHLRQQFEDEANHILAVTRQEHVTQLLELQTKLEEVNAQLNGLNAAVNATEVANNASVTLHQHSAAVLALEAALSASLPFKGQLEAVKASSDGDSLVQAVAESIDAISASGAPTLVDLRSRFAVVRNEVRKAALAPEGPPSIISQAIGNTLAAISKAPKGYVKGDGIEEILARASFCLEQGNIKQALAELDTISGYARVLMNDWEGQAKSRLLVDQSSRALRASAALRHSSFA